MWRFFNWWNLCHLWNMCKKWRFWHFYWFWKLSNLFIFENFLKLVSSWKSEWHMRCDIEDFCKIVVLLLYLRYWRCLYGLEDFLWWFCYVIMSVYDNLSLFVCLLIYKLWSSTIWQNIFLANFERKRISRHLTILHAYTARARKVKLCENVLPILSPKLFWSCCCG